MPGLRRAAPRVRVRGFSVHHADGTITRVMQSERQVSDRVVVVARVAIRGASPDGRASVSADERADIVRALREMADGWEALGYEPARDRSGKAPA